MTTRLLTVAALPIIAALALAAPAPAHAGGSSGGGGGTRVIRTGDCSGVANWKIKAKADDGLIQVEAEVDSNQAGQAWAWTLRHEGAVAAKGTRQTAGRSGSFSIERRTSNAAGADSFTFRATHAGQTCVARVTLP